MASIEIDGVNGVIKNTTSDADIFIKGNDGGSEITALTFDISAAGAATFNDKITAVGTSVFTNLDISGDIDVDGTTNLDVVDIDGAVDMASTLQVDGAITTSDGMVITTADVNPQLTIISTEAGGDVAPLIDLYRNSSSPADGDVLGQLRYYGENSADEKIEYVRVRAGISDVTDGTEDSNYTITTFTGGSQNGRLNILPTETVFNENSADLDFRVESDGNANMLFVNGGNDRVGIGSGSPESVLHVEEASTPKVTIRSIDGTSASIKLQRQDENDVRTDFELKNDGGVFKIISDNSSINERAIVNFESAEVTFNEGAQDIDFRVESSGVANMFFVDGGNSEVQASNTGSFYDTDRVFSARQSQNNGGICHFSTAPSDYANQMITIAGNREESTAEEFIRMNDSNDQQIIFRGDGNGFFDGAADAGNADFAEYFESTDGSILAIGKTVVLDNGKVRASTDSDSASDIVGVVRHRKTVGVVGNSAWSKWKGKYKVDDYGVPEYEDYTVTKWTEEFTEDAEPLVITYNGETHNHGRIKGGKIDHSYQSDKIPSNLTVPDDAVVVNKDPKGNDLKRKILNDDYDASKEYLSREFRDEWNLIGLTGQVTMTKGQKTGDRWIKMRDISDSVEEWLVR